MSPEFIVGLMAETMKTTIMLALPILASGLIAGVLVSMLQAATQINEMTLVFIPKMIAVGIAILLFFPWMLQVITDFTQGLITGIPTWIR